MNSLYFGAGIVVCSALVACASDNAANDGSALAGSGGQPGDAQSERPNCLPNVPSECVQEMCRKEKFDCGGTESVLDDFGCYRAKCSSSAQCKTGEECRDVTYGPITCGFAPPNDQVCACGNSLSLVTERMCFPQVQP